MRIRRRLVCRAQKELLADFPAAQISLVWSICYEAFRVQAKSTFCSPREHCSFRAFARKCAVSTGHGKDARPGDERERGNPCRPRKSNARKENRQRDTVCPRILPVMPPPQKFELFSAIGRRARKGSGNCCAGCSGERPRMLPPRTSQSTPQSLTTQPHPNPTTQVCADSSARAWGPLNQTKPGLQPGLRSFWRSASCS